MIERSQMEIEYEKYVLSEDKFIEKDGVTLYKIIHKERLSVNGGIVLICIPFEFFNHSSINMVTDENKRIFKLGGFVHYSFRGTIPDWYLNTVTVNVENIHEINEIGDYLSL